MNVNNPQEKLVGYFAIIFSWHIFDPQFFNMCFQEKSENFSVLVIDSDTPLLEGPHLILVTA